MRGVLRLLDATCECRGRELVLRGPCMAHEITLQAASPLEAEEWKAGIDKSTTS